MEEGRKVGSIGFEGLVRNGLGESGMQIESLLKGGSCSEA